MQLTIAFINNFYFQLTDLLLSLWNVRKKHEKMPTTGFESPSPHVQIAYFVWSTAWKLKDIQFKMMQTRVKQEPANIWYFHLIKSLKLLKTN